MAVRDLIKADKRIRKLLMLLKKGRFTFDCNGAIKEIQSLHVNRSGRDINVKEVIQKFQSKFLEAVLHAQANRTRIVQIKMNAFVIYAKLDKHTTLVKQHIKATYGTQLNHVGSTAADRDNVVSHVLEKAYNHLKDLKVVMDIADIAIEDLDKVGWSFKTVTTIMEQVGERKMAKV